MLDFKQFKQLVVDTLEEMDAYKEEAVLAIMMLVAHESRGGKYLKQVGGGPALGCIQMEGWVHDDTWQHSDNIHKYAEMLCYDPKASRLRYDLRYAIFMARCRFLMDVNPFPKTETEMAEYLKDYWNSDAGAAHPEDYLKAYREWAGVYV